MSGTVPSSQTSEDETQEENQAARGNFALQFLSAIGFGAVVNEVEMRKAVKFLSNPINQQKLLNDPRYQNEVLSVLNIIKKKQNWWRKPKSLPDTHIQNVTTATRHAVFGYDQRIKVKTKFSEFYAKELRVVYGLDEKELKTVLEKALTRVTDNPSLLFQDACTIEVRETVKGKVAKEVEKEKIAKEKRKDEVTKRLDGKEKQFTSRTTTLRMAEQQACSVFEYNANQEIAKTLTTLPRQPSPIQAKPVVSASPSISKHPSPPPQFRFPKFSFSLPKISLPKFSLPPGNFFKGISGGFKSFFSKAVSKGASLAVKAGVKVAGKLGLKALGQALATALPGIGNAAMALIQALGIDEAMMKFALWGAVFAVAVPVAILLLFILGLSNSNIIPSYSSRDAISVAFTQNTTLGWKDFEGKFLTQITSWSKFEKENLIPGKTYLSFE